MFDPWQVQQELNDILDAGSGRNRTNLNLPSLPSPIMPALPGLLPLIPPPIPIL